MRLIMGCPGDVFHRLAHHFLQGVAGLDVAAMLDAGIPLVTGSDGPAYWPADPLRERYGVLARRHGRALGVVLDG